MAMVSFTVSRNIDATNPIGLPCKIAIATVIHENGHQHTVAIPEEKIRLMGEGIIEAEVRRAAAK
jgi:hypothetical protein